MGLQPMPKIKFYATVKGLKVIEHSTKSRMLDLYHAFRHPDDLRNPYMLHLTVVDKHFPAVIFRYGREYLYIDTRLYYIGYYDTETGESRNALHLTTMEELNNGKI